MPIGENSSVPKWNIVLNKLHELKEVSFGWIDLEHVAIKMLSSLQNNWEFNKLENRWTIDKFVCGGNDDLSLKRLCCWYSCNFMEHSLQIHRP
jgi:hypothetical protein